MAGDRAGRLAGGAEQHLEAEEIVREQPLGAAGGAGRQPREIRRLGDIGAMCERCVRAGS